MLSADISRCTNKECTLPCRRKEPAANEWQSYILLISGKVKKCKFQIKIK